MKEANVEKAADKYVIRYGTDRTYTTAMLLSDAFGATDSEVTIRAGVPVGRIDVAISKTINIIENGGVMLGDDDPKSIVTVNVEDVR